MEGSGAAEEGNLLGLIAFATLRYGIPQLIHKGENWHFRGRM
jgi:hypothetical protein